MLFISCSSELIANGAELRRQRVGDCSRARASTEARTLEKEEEEL